MNKLDIPVPVSFQVKMETDKAFIVQNVELQGTLVIPETNLPKMYCNLLKSVAGGAKSPDATKAEVESWVLKQRIEEYQNTSVENAIAEILSISQSTVLS